MSCDLLRHEFYDNQYLADPLVIMSVAMIIANYSDRWCLMLTDKIFGLEYEEYHEVKISNKDRLKQEAARKKNRKGLFR